MKCVQIEKEITKIKYKTKQNKWNLVLVVQPASEIPDFYEILDCLNMFLPRRTCLIAS